MFTRKPDNLRTRFYMIFSLITLIIYMNFLTYHHVVNKYTQKNANENLTYIIQKLFDNMQQYFNDMDKISSMLATDKSIQKFIQEGSPGWYGFGDEATASIENAASHNPGYLIGTILYDNDMSFYRYNIGFNNSVSRELYYQYGTDKSRTVRDISFINNNIYYGIYRNVYKIESTNAVHVGGILVLGNLDKLIDMIKEYNSISGIHISLWNGDELILSSHPMNEDTSQKDILKDTVFLSEKFSSNGLELIVSMDKHAVFPYRSVFFILIIVVLVCTLAFLMLFLLSTNQLVINPISQLIADMKKIKTNGPEPGAAADPLSNRLPATNSTVINWLVNNINDLLERLEDYRDHSLEAQKMLFDLELKKHNMEMFILRKSINSHFIFNTLTNISILMAEREQPKIAQSVKDLAELIRYTHSKDEYINIFDELRLLDKYINIMNIQYNNKLEVSYNVDDSLVKYLILKQLLQPIVENSFMHGFQNKHSDCLLEITGTEEEGKIRITIRDNGVGISPDTIEKINESFETYDEEDYSNIDGSIALKNINRRIKLYYGKDYGLTIESPPDGGTAISVIFPVIIDKK